MLRQTANSENMLVHSSATVAGIHTPIQPRSSVEILPFLSRTKNV